jgi:Uncharacterised protein family UPF0547
VNLDGCVTLLGVGQRTVVGDLAVSRYRCHMSLTADLSATEAFGGSASVVVRNYPGRSQSEAANTFAQEAQVASRYGYLPVSQSWGEGRAGIKRVALIGIGSMVWKPKGFLTVTYTKSGSEIVAPPITVIGGSLSDLERSDIEVVHSYRPAPWGSSVTTGTPKIRPDGDVWLPISNTTNRSMPGVAVVVTWWELARPFRSVTIPEIGTLEYVIPTEDSGRLVATRKVAIRPVRPGSEALKVKRPHRSGPREQPRAAIYAIDEGSGDWVTAEQITPKMFTDWERERPAEPEPAQPEPETKTCPMCAEEVKSAAKICRFCRYEFAQS